MALLFRLPFMLLELLLRRLLGGDDATTATVVTPEPVTTPPARPSTGAGVNGAPPPTADEAIERSQAREAVAQAAPDPTPPTPLRPISGHDDHIDRETEIVESFGPAQDVGDVGGTITVDTPWPDYDEQSATAIVQRLRDADAATKAVVALYERANKNRATVLRAAG